MQTILILYHSNEFSLINKFFNLFIHIMCMYVKTAKQIYIYIYFHFNVQQTNVCNIKTTIMKTNINLHSKYFYVFKIN